MVDFNCDVGEGIANEHLLMPHITSCNIACGGHFGDENSIYETIQCALKNNVLIGAHPSFSDKENFGRKWIQITNENLSESIQYQMDLFMERMFLNKATLHHIKPHGALYNAIAKDENIAKIFVNSILKYSRNSFLYVPYKSEIEKVAIKNNIKIIYEAFADRNYNDDLTLVNRTYSNATITDKKKVFQHVSKIVFEGKVKTISGIQKEIKAATFCVHSDTENAVEIIKYLSKKFKK